VVGVQPGIIYPSVAQVARSYLNIPAALVAIAREFPQSVGWSFQTGKPHALSAEHVQQLVFFVTELVGLCFVSLLLTIQFVKFVGHATA
jgi:hypothetical protein